MEHLLFDIFFWVVFVGGGVLFIIFCIIKEIEQRKKHRAEQETLSQKAEDMPAEPEYYIDKMKATVIDQGCYVRTMGTKFPKTVREFVVVFEMENGDVLKLNVPEETYDGFEQGQTGILSLIDGQLYSFEI